MINREPSAEQMAALWHVCSRFVEAQEISCEETIYQTDWVIENAYELVQQICDVVGYLENDDEE